ncbi:putative cell surface glycoprotein [Tieghemostelium lacteum]|uniref:Putative cell surface glycoprotein n=1 Tax=Tieghemostelium lacteum TaxID=361077 RepID=A0A152A824_TIELA|nr:putative cell surface glycoprotein [Tieghemostelium lacteum]|eukprot:KYR02197.1 putative cell surface glycoprotein [Tieghemostelium lacteum]
MKSITVLLFIFSFLYFFNFTHSQKLCTNFGSDWVRVGYHLTNVYSTVNATTNFQQVDVSFNFTTNSTGKTIDVTLGYLTTYGKRSSFIGGYLFSNTNNLTINLYTYNVKSGVYPGIEVFNNGSDSALVNLVGKICVSNVSTSTTSVTTSASTNGGTVTTSSTSGGGLTVTTTSSSSTISTTGTYKSSDVSPKELKTGLIVAGVVLFVIIAVILFYNFVFKKRNRHHYVQV